MAKENTGTRNDRKENLEPIVWKKWKVSKYDPDIIIGEWAEDGNEYNIKVPVQLRDMIIKMQNDAVDANETKKPKKELCNSCGGKGFHYIMALDGNKEYGYYTNYNERPCPKCNKIKGTNFGDDVL